MRYYALLTAYIVTTTSAIVLFKLGAGKSSLNLSNGVFSGAIEGRALAGIFLYGISFALWLLLLTGRPVVYIVPLTTALVHIAIVVASLTFLQERVTSLQVAGIGLVITGAAMISIKSA
jgi:drug/metabolite transporter (DMT)-like permease